MMSFQIKNKLLVFTLLVSIAMQKVSSVQIPFEHLETEMGLSVVRDIYRDRQDYLWIANRGFGLMRYNTSQIKNYRHSIDDSTSISSDNLNKIYEDSKGNLWIGTFNGLDKLNRKTGKFTHYLNLKGDSINLTTRYINDIEEDKSGRLWIATGSGLHEYLYAEDQFVFHPNVKTSARDNNFTSIELDHNENLWLAGLAPAIFRYNKSTRDFDIFEMEQLDKSLRAYKYLLIDSDNILWIGSNIQGLVNFNQERNIFKYFPVEEKYGTNTSLIREIKEFVKGKIYIATDQGGLNIFDKETGEFSYVSSAYNNAGNLSSDGIYCMEMDNEGILWLGTSRGGINYYNPKKYRFNTLKKSTGISQANNKNLSHGVVGALLEHSDGSIWIGTDGGGINVFNRETGMVKVYTASNSNLSSNTIRALSEDSNGDVWIATWSDKLNKFIRKDEQFIQVGYSANIELGSQSQPIWSAKIDDKDRLWLVYIGGLTILVDKNGDEILRMLAPHDPIHYFNEVVFINNPREYFLNTTNGIYRLNEEENILELFIQGNEIVSFAKDINGNYWTGTLNQGAFNYTNTGELIAKYNKENGLSSNCVYSIECTSNGMVWLATDMGLNQFIQSDNSIHKYFSSDGLQSNQYFMQASLKTKDEQLFFGGRKGVDYFHPRDILLNTYLPKVYITSLEVTNRDEELKSIPDLGEILFNQESVKLDWKNNKVIFHFQAINFTFPEKTHYKYKLNGLDSEYTTSSDKYATYTNLEAGAYVFHVMASNNDGLWNTEGTALKIVMKPPWWKTIGARIGFVAIVLTFFLSIYFYRVNLLRIQKEHLEKLVKIRTIELDIKNKELAEKNKIVLETNQQLQERQMRIEQQHELLSQLNATKDKLFSIIGHDLRSPFNTIMGYSELLIKKIKIFSKEKITDRLLVIKDAASNTLILLNNLLEWSRAQQGILQLEIEPLFLSNLLNNELLIHRQQADQKGVVIENSIKDSEFPVEADRNLLSAVIRNLISNAIKFSKKNSSISITLNYSNKYQVLFSVKDEGVGMNVDKIGTLFKTATNKSTQGTSGEHGTGLGLLLCAEFIEKHHGKIWAESTVDKGSTFFFTIPKTYKLLEDS